MILFLSKLFGLYFIIIGLIVLISRKSIMPAISEISKNRPLLFAMGIIEIAAGLALVLGYPTLSWSAGGVLSIIGYVMVTEGIIYLAAPIKFVHKLIKSFNRPEWHTSGALVAIIMGAYLAGVGFGVI